MCLIDFMGVLSGWPSSKSPCGNYLIQSVPKIKKVNIYNLDVELIFAFNSNRCQLGYCHEVLPMWKWR